MRTCVRNTAFLLLMLSYGQAACAATVVSITTSLGKSCAQDGPVTLAARDDASQRLPQKTISRRYLTMTRSFSPAHFSGIRLGATLERAFTSHHPISFTIPLTLRGHGDPMSVRPPPSR